MISANTNAILACSSQRDLLDEYGWINEYFLDPETGMKVKILGFKAPLIGLILAPLSFPDRPAISFMSRHAEFSLQTPSNSLPRIGQSQEKEHLIGQLCRRIKLSLQWAWLGVSFLLGKLSLMPHLVDGSSGGQPAQTSSRLDFEVIAFLFLLLTALFSLNRMRFLGALGRKGAMFTCFEIVGLFLAWIKASLPAIQPRSLIHNVVWAQSPS